MRKVKFLELSFTQFDAQEHIDFIPLSKALFRTCANVNTVKLNLENFHIQDIDIASVSEAIRTGFPKLKSLSLRLHNSSKYITDEGVDFLSNALVTKAPGLEALELALPGYFLYSNGSSKCRTFLK